MVSRSVDPHRVRELRESKGFSARKLAETAKVSERAIRYIESGCSQPYGTTLHKLARALGVEITELLVSDVDDEDERVA